MNIDKYVEEFDNKYQAFELSSVIDKPSWEKHRQLFKSSIQDALKEFAEEVNRERQFIKNVHNMELDAIACKSLEDFVIWADNRKSSAVKDQSQLITNALNKLKE